MQIQSQQNVAYIAQLVGEPDNYHRDAWKVWDLAHVFNAQRI